MYKLMRKYNKKLLAIFGVGLMIVFVLPTQMKNNTGRGEGVYGHVGDEKVSAEEVRQARAEWSALNHEVLRPIRDPYTGRGRLLPLAQAFFGQDVGNGFAIKQITDHAPMYWLLQKEAHQRGVRVSERDVEAELSQLNFLSNDQKDQRLLDFSSLSEAQQQGMRQVVANAMLVRASFQHAADAVKISQPIRDRGVARYLQRIRVQATDFSAADFMANVSAPTPQELTEQFNKYADVDPETAESKANPAAYGYRYPDRVKLQYVEIPRAELTK